MTEEGVTLCVLVGAFLACDHSRTVPVKLYHILIEHSYSLVDDWEASQFLL